MTLVGEIAVAAIEALGPFIKFLQLLLRLYSITNLNSSDLYKADTNLTDHASFDFIIVGAGSSGCVLANRLTEVENWNVLLIEAGDNPDLLTTTPGLPFMVTSSKTDWNRFTVNDNYSSQAHKYKNIHMTSGKMLGGSSGANFMFYVRGNKADFDDWVAQGNEGWDWDNVTYYYKKSENMTDSTILNSASAYLHNTDGYLHVSRPDWTEETSEYFDALRENGREILVDTNGPNQIGYSLPQFTFYDGKRQSSAYAFLSPIKDRPNLHILRNTKCRKVILDENNTATGVEIKLSNGTITTVYANKEIILSTGAYVSPQLLMLSGIGPSDYLKEMDIEVKVDSPQVGKNSMDHPLVTLSITGRKNSSSMAENLSILNRLDRFSVPVIMGHVALDEEQTYPDYQSFIFPLPASSIFPFIFYSHMMKLNDSICSTVVESGIEKEQIMVVISYQHTESKGQIKLKSNNPDDHSLIHSGYFSDTRDKDRFALYIEDFLTILNTTVMQNMNAELVNMNVTQCDHLEFASHDYWKCFALNTASTEWHTSCTCRMGREGSGVVNERLQVYGTQGLRVVDTSIMPNMTSANTNAPAMMIGEKAADMIKEDHGIVVVRTS